MSPQLIYLLISASLTAIERVVQLARDAGKEPDPKDVALAESLRAELIRQARQMDQAD